MIIYRRIIAIIMISLCSISMTAQEVFYYNKDKKIPLTINNSKVCVSIPKNLKSDNNPFVKSIKPLDRIMDNDFDTYVINQSDLHRLKTDDIKSVPILYTYCYRVENGTEVYSTPYLDVRLKKEQDFEVLLKYANRYGLRIVKQDSFLPLWYILSLTPESSKNALVIANELWESGEFAASIPDFCSKDLTASNDPQFNLQWGLHNSDYTDIDISAESAWNYSTGSNVKIAILDTGVDLNHIDLSSNISSLSFDTESGTSPSVYYGDHATHCAGIAAAVKDNGISIAGVAPDATIVSISNRLESSAHSLLKRADGIIWAYQNGADIISNSWKSSTPNIVIEEAINDAFRYGRHGKGCIIVFASGNDNGNVCYPANCNDTILVVGAIDRTGGRASYSNYGSTLDVVAPGSNILSTLPNNQTDYMSGTSMACPHVAGVAALILERNPELTVEQVNSIICSNAKKISGVNFNLTKPEGSWNNEYGYGLVDAYSSVINTPHVVYIQNETVTGTKVISADSIYVGENVTDTKTYGGVILGQGNITLKADYIEIKNSTAVPLGTTLIIEN